MRCGFLWIYSASRQRKKSRAKIKKRRKSRDQRRTQAAIDPQATLAEAGKMKYTAAAAAAATREKKKKKKGSQFLVGV
jgi:23S rRNA pseudoU1915 N3-methylase RlmH